MSKHVRCVIYLSIYHMADVFLTRGKTLKTLLTAENVREMS